MWTREHINQLPVILMLEINSNSTQFKPLYDKLCSYSMKSLLSKSIENIISQLESGDDDSETQDCDLSDPNDTAFIPDSNEDKSDDDDRSLSGNSNSSDISEFEFDSYNKFELSHFYKETRRHFFHIQVQCTRL